MCVTSESGHSKPRARLRRAQRDRHRCIHHRRSHLRVSGTRCALLRRLPSRVAVSQKKATQQPSGVNGLSAIQHNRALFAAAPVVRCALLVGRPRITSGYVSRPCRLPHARCCHACSKDSRCARAGKATGTSTFVWSRALRRCGVCGLSPALGAPEAHPFARRTACRAKPRAHPTRSQARGSRCAARSRASVPAPVRPRWGLPLKSKAKGQTQALARFARHNAAKSRTSSRVCTSSTRAALPCVAMRCKGYTRLAPHV